MSEFSQFDISVGIANYPWQLIHIWLISIIGNYTLGSPRHLKGLESLARILRTEARALYRDGLARNYKASTYLPYEAGSIEPQIEKEPGRREVATDNYRLV